MASLTSSYENLSPSVLADPETYCTISTCPLTLAYVLYRPSLPGNVLYAGFFGLFLFAQLLLGIRHRTWGFLIGMFGGILLEIMGYIGRIQMHYNPFLRGPFLMYLCCITVGPAFLSASIYLILARIIPVYSSTISRFQPRTYTFLFITCDIIALLPQAAGGAIASLAGDETTTKLGINIMVAGVAWQVFSLGLFAVLCAEFAWKVRKAREEDLIRDLDFVEFKQTERFRIFLWAVVGATLAIFVRSVFRCAELRDGFRGELANDEMTFMILEGAMIVIAVGLLTVWHPGLAYRGKWADAAWSIRSDTRKKDRKELITRNAEERRIWESEKGRSEKRAVEQRFGEPPPRPYRP